MEKLTIAFTSGYHTQVVFTYASENLHSDLGSLFEEILNEQILPNGWYGLVESLVDEEYTTDYEDYMYIDKGYYFYMPCVHVEMMSDEKINEYIENGIQVIDMEVC